MNGLLPIEQLIKSQYKSTQLKEMPKLTKIKVLIADARLAMRDSLSRSLMGEPGINIIGAVDNGMQAILRAIELKPEVVVVDMTLPDHGGLLAVISIKQKLPGTRILVRNLSDSEVDLIKALRFGAQGYIPLNVKVEEITKIIQRVVREEAHLHPDLIGKLMDEFQKIPEDWQSLSRIEREVLNLSREGMSESRIAHSLFISESLVRECLFRFLEKLHLRNLSQAQEYLKAGRLNHG